MQVRPAVVFTVPSSQRIKAKRTGMMQPIIPSISALSASVSDLAFFRSNGLGEHVAEVLAVVSKLEILSKMSHHCNCLNLVNFVLQLLVHDW